MCQMWRRPSLIHTRGAHHAALDSPPALCPGGFRHAFCRLQPGPRRTGRPRPAQRQDRHARPRDSRSAGARRQGRHDSGRRDERLRAAAHRRRHRGHRPRRSARHTWLHRQPRPLHGDWRGPAEPRPDEHEELGRDRLARGGGGEEVETGRLDPGPRLAPGEVGQPTLAVDRRIPDARFALGSLARQPGDPDPCQRPRDVRQPQCHGACGNHQGDEGSAGRRDPQDAKGTIGLP